MAEHAVAIYDNGWQCSCSCEDFRINADRSWANYGAQKHMREFTPPKARPSLDDTLMDVARVWSRRSTCTRLQVGAILVRDGRPFAQGFNGPARGENHCRHVDDEPCLESVHGETNVLINSAKDGYATKGATMFVTHSPCRPCAANIINSEIVEVVFAEPYRDSAGIERLESAGIDVRRLD